MKKSLIGYQVYSARDDAAKDLLGTLKDIKALGYDGVEFAGFYGHEAKEVKAMLAEAGLVAISHHVPFAAMREDIFKVISDNKLIGVKYIAIPFLDADTRPGSAGFAETIKDICLYGELMKAAGIQLLYHNHDFEFCTVSGQYGLDFLYSAVPPCKLATEIDVCWVKYAGLEPADYIRKYAGRCDIVHLKDFVGRKEGDKSPYALIGVDKDTAKADEGVAFEFRPVGYGCQVIPTIVEAAQASGAKWFIVEQDLSVGRTPLEAAKMSVDYLRGLGL
jgi:sugar phosphate isomerase/epimerase